MVVFGPETSEFTTLIIAPLWRKSAYHAKYVRISWTYLDLLYRFGKHIIRDDYPNIRLAVAQGTLLWQPVKFGGCSQTSPGTTFSLYDDREATFKRVNNCHRASRHYGKTETRRGRVHFTLMLSIPLAESGALTDVLSPTDPWLRSRSPRGKSGCSHGMP